MEYSSRWSASAARLAEDTPGVAIGEVAPHDI
jgi:hypothetical protein